MSLTHFDKAGQAHMVDVSGKPDTAREAVAEGCVIMAPETLALAQDGTKKGDVMALRVWPESWRPSAQPT